jgi:apoptosis-inducing factor 2
MSKRFQDQKNVVIVGGGAAGMEVARGLSAKLDASKYNLILVNPRPYAIHMLAGARLTTSDVGHLEDTAFIPYDKLFVNGNGSLKVGKVTAIEVNKGGKGGVLTLQDGEKLPYEILVLTPGSVWNGAVAFPDDQDEVTQWVKQWRDKFKRANHIVFAGGGAVGIESAGEVKDQFPVGFKVFVLHRHL